MTEIEQIDYDKNVCCPKCNKEIVVWKEYKDEGLLSPCEHTLFIAFELGFVYCDSRMENHLKLNLPKDFDLTDEYLKFEFFEEQNYGIDDLIELNIPNLKIISVFTPAPHSSGTIFGFILD